MSKERLLILLGVTGSAQHFWDGLAMAWKNHFLILDVQAWASDKHILEEVLVPHCSSKSLSDTKSVRVLLSFLNLA